MTRSHEAHAERRWVPDAASWNAAIHVHAGSSTLAVYALLATGLLASWLGPGLCRGAWDRLDALAFAMGNGSLAVDSAWTTFWAFANTRFFDAVVATAMLGLYADHAFSGRGRWVRERLWLGIAMALFTAVWMTFVMKLGVGQHRLSPTLVESGAFRLSEHYDWIVRVKDSARNSFPGDHVGVVVLVGLIVFHVADRWRGVAILLMGLPVAVPRVVGGAHWLTDQVVGGMSSGLLGAAVFLGALCLARTVCDRHVARRASPSH